MLPRMSPLPFPSCLLPHDFMGLGALLWDVDRVWFRIGPVDIRYYGVCLMLTLAVGYYLVWLHFKGRGYPDDVPQRYLAYLLVGFFVGARLGHCFFYHPGDYLLHPLDILKLWQGGIASHGAGVGMTLAALLFHFRHRIPFLVVADGTVLPAAVGAVFVRIGNFFNSEIVGRVTDVPWAVVFARRDMQPRHPSQIYEALGGLAVLIVLLVLRRRRDLRPGVLAGVFLTSYFTFRFGVEFFKEYHAPTGFFTMGQYLSVPFVAFGVGVLAAALRRRPGMPSSTDDAGGPDKM